MSMHRMIVIIAIFVTAVITASVIAKDGVKATRVASNLPDLSGVVWMEDDIFIAVHDAKNPDELSRPRVSVVRLPRSLEGVTWNPLKVSWPEPLGKSSDLESAARIPGQPRLLFAESGDDKGSFQRIFLASFEKGSGLTLEDSINWPHPVFNVEGIAVAKVGAHLVFFYAERSDGNPTTQIRWAKLHLNPFRIGSFREVNFTTPGPRGPNARPVTAMEVDSSGRTYVASAFDSGDDNGPFSSNVWEIGQWILDNNGDPQLNLYQKSIKIATGDGLKIEGIAVRELSAAEVEVFIGVDDENYGGTLRLLRLKK